MSGWWRKAWGSDAAPVSEHMRCESVEQLAHSVHDPSGYVRERALHQCIALARPEVLPLLAGRLNDWVPQVRDVARAGLLSLAPSMPPQALLDTLASIARLRTARRSDHAAWIAAYEDLVIQGAGRAALREGMHGGPRARARACFLLARRAGYLDAGALTQLAGPGAADIVLASQAISFCAQLPPKQGVDVYRSALASPFGGVRAIALRGLLALHPVDHAGLALAALNSPQCALREVAIAHLARNGQDAAPVYRGHLAANEGSARQLSFALLGLASLRRAEDLGLFRQFAHHPASVVRLAALSAWLRLAHEDKDELAALAVADGSAAVRKFALYAVQRQGAYLPFDWVRERLEARGDLVLLLRFSESVWWNWIECIARAALRRPWDATLAELLARQLRSWLDGGVGVYSAPTPSQKVFLDEPYVRATLARLLERSVAADPRQSEPCARLLARLTLALAR